MGRQFQIPTYYRAPLVSSLKVARRTLDQRKKDLSPTIIEAGRLRFKLARHFGFCFGVENAIEIAYRAIAASPGKRVFLLSEMIHNPHVNADLQARGVRFLMRPDGTRLLPFSELTPDDVVIVPAFGTTLEIVEELRQLGVNPHGYDTTCPFVEKVWSRAEQLGSRGYSVIIHGKASHEETRASFSHARRFAPSLVIEGMSEARWLVDFITGGSTPEEIFRRLPGRYSEGFDPVKHLARIGVVNQTTMLAGETQAICDVLRDAMRTRYGEAALADHFADTRDTLCYATSENQAAVRALAGSGGALALVVGGYNSSNTSHLVELIEETCPTYFVRDATELISREQVRHFSLRTKQVEVTENWLRTDGPVIEILVAAGASCPDQLIEEVMLKVCSFLEVEAQFREAVAAFVAGADGARPINDQSQKLTEVGA